MSSMHVRLRRSYVGFYFLCPYFRFFLQFHFRSSTAFQNHRDQILNNAPATPSKSATTSTALPLQPSNVTNVSTSTTPMPQLPTQPVSPNPAQMMAQLQRKYTFCGLLVTKISEPAITKPDHKIANHIATSHLVLPQIGIIGP